MAKAEPDEHPRDQRTEAEHVIHRQDVDDRTSGLLDRGLVKQAGCALEVDQARGVRNCLLVVLDRGTADR